MTCIESLVKELLRLRTLYCVLGEQGSVGVTTRNACRKCDAIMLGMNGVFVSWKTIATMSFPMCLFRCNCKNTITMKLITWSRMNWSQSYPDACFNVDGTRRQWFFFVPLQFDSPYITMKNQAEAEQEIAVAKYHRCYFCCWYHVKCKQKANEDRWHLVTAIYSSAPTCYPFIKKERAQWKRNNKSLSPSATILIGRGNWEVHIYLRLFKGQVHFKVILTCWGSCSVKGSMVATWNMISRSLYLV